MKTWPLSRGLPRHVVVLLALYTAASLLHFTHNAEYIAFYPNMPASITRENVYIAWLTTAAVGVAGVGAWSVGWRAAGAAVIALYGALGLDGLGHYALARCAEHTFAMNFTIGFEVVTGVTLAAAALRLAVQQRTGALRIAA